MNASIRLLHADDSPDMRELTRTFLMRESDRFEIMSVTDGSEAISAFESAQFDCIISDYDMPQMDGLSLLELVRTQDPYVPFILFTGKGSEEVASEAISNGVTDYIQKGGPERYELLANNITNAVSRYRTREFRAVVRDDPLSFLDRFSDPLHALNSDWEFSYLNAAATEMFGRPDAELLGENIWELFPEATETPFYDRYHETVADGVARTIEEPFEPWGKWYREYLYPDEDGLTVVTYDITKEKQREQELERSRELRRHTEKITAVGGWEILDGELRWTEGTYRIHGFDSSSEFHPSIDDGIEFYHPDDRRKINAAVKRCLEMGESYELELRLQRVDGKTRCVKTHGVPIEGDGEIVGARGAIQDITELREQFKTDGDSSSKR